MELSTAGSLPTTPAARLRGWLSPSQPGPTLTMGFLNRALTLAAVPAPPPDLDHAAIDWDLLIRDRRETTNYLSAPRQGAGLAFGDEARRRLAGCEPELRIIYYITYMCTRMIHTNIKLLIDASGC